MPVPITFDPLFDYAPAFAGMLADAMFTDKVTVPCGAASIPFGAVVASVTSTGVSALPFGTITTGTPDTAALTAGVVIEGIAIHEQQLGARRAQTTGYVVNEPISVLRRGRIWARASGACTKDAVAKLNVTTGVFADVEVYTLANARFLSGMLTVPAIWPGETTQQIVLVELHAPNVA